jgi:hypothetical protein
MGQDEETAGGGAVAIPDDTDALEPTGGEPVFVLRGLPVILDVRVAAAFSVATREVNQAVARNPAKFASSYRFQLTEDERARLMSQGVIAKPGRGGSRRLPYVYTRKGVARLATILDTPSSLAATDRMIDLCTAICQQIALGDSTLVIPEPARHVPDRTTLAQVKRLGERLLEAVADLPEKPVRAESKAANPSDGPEWVSSYRATRPPHVRAALEGAASALAEPFYTFLK